MKRITIFLAVMALVFTAVPTMCLAYSVGQSGPGFIYGDATGNSSVTADDATLILLYYVGIYSGSLPQPGAADINDDGAINIIDSLLIYQHLWDYNMLDEKLFQTVYDNINDSWSYALTNNTTQVWTDFHFRLDQYSSDFFNPPDFPDYDNYIFSETSSVKAYSGPGSYIIGNQNRSIDVVGLNIGIGESFSFSLNTSGTGHYGLFGQPTTGLAPIPEPATMLLLASGLAGLIGFRRKFRKR